MKEAWNLGQNTICFSGCFLVLDGWLQGYMDYYSNISFSVLDRTWLFQNFLFPYACITLHLSVLNLIPHRSTTTGQIIERCLRFSESVWFITMCPTFVSSVNFLLILTHSSFINIINECHKIEENSTSYPEKIQIAPFMLLKIHWVLLFVLYVVTSFQSISELLHQ